LVFFHGFAGMAVVVHGFTEIAVVVAPYGFTGMIVGNCFHGVDHSNGPFCCYKINQKYQERSNFRI